MDARDIAIACNDLHSKDREELVKSCMDTAFEKMSDVDTNNTENKVPSDKSLFTYVPSKDKFVEYATEILKSKVSTDDILVEMMVPIIKSLRKSSRNKRRISTETENEVTPKRQNSSRVEESIVDPNPRNLPEVLNPTASGSMTSVSREYFPDSEFVFPGIYVTPDGGYVLFCVDNGRYANSWVHEQNVTKFTWVTATKDKSRSTLESISLSPDVHVFRKIQGEVNFRYMGRVIENGEMDKKTGSIVLSVC